MDDFKKLVDECFDKELNRDISNGSIAHALILIRKLIQMAQKHNEPLKIVSGRFRPAFYDQLVDDIKNTKVSIEIIAVEHITDDEIRSNKFIQAVAQNEQNTFLSFKNAITDMPTHPHFVLVGKKRYRLERDDKKAIAIGNGNNELLGGTLSAIFDRLKENVKHYNQAAVAS